jgi:DNA-binding NarL/FixJ family response regulator
MGVMTQRRRILIVDGSRYFNKVVWHMLIPDSSFDLVGLARQPEEALEMAVSLLPDIILVDISHAAPRGLEAIATLHAAQPAVPIVAFIPVSSSEYNQAALSVGASACLPKAEVVDVLLQTIGRLIHARPPEHACLFNEGVG